MIDKLKLVVFLAATAPLMAQMSVTLRSSVPSPAPLGTVVTWTPTVVNGGSGTLWYRYRARRAGADIRRGSELFHMIRDFGPEANLDWTNIDHEGLFEMELVVRNTTTGEAVTQTALFQLTPIATDKPAITKTANSLVLLYSAPPCPTRSKMRVQFQDAAGNVQTTPLKSCSGRYTMNFYLAGMRPNTQYSINHTITGSVVQGGPVLTATTGSLPSSVALTYRVLKPSQVRVVNGVLVQGTLSPPMVATDLSGNVIWYYEGNISFLTRPEEGGRFLGIAENPRVPIATQLVREFDLAGNTLQETNAARINEQLAALGKRSISGFHHEARRLPDGRLMVLADVEQILTDVQGAGPVDVLGDMILVLDRELQLVWAWDAFDHLDVTRLATLKEVCGQIGGGCPPFYQAQLANDWLHGNSLQLTPDGNILYSARHQDWIIKIDYANGAGSGNVIWRLGKDGDFTFLSGDPFPWPSHQHDPGFVSDDPTKLAVFDNGNVRHDADNSSRSRGQLIQLDEQRRTATLLLNADLGAYSMALGSAQRLPNGNYHFDAGFIADPSGGQGLAQSIEVDPSGNIVFNIQASRPEYRTFRLSSLYVSQ